MTLPSVRFTARSAAVVWTLVSAAGIAIRVQSDMLPFSAVFIALAGVLGWLTTCVLQHYTVGSGSSAGLPTALFEDDDRRRERTGFYAVMGLLAILTAALYLIGLS